MSDELADLARMVIDANSYMALGTADEAGHPWVSPVRFASEDYRHFLWVSSPNARHSQNLEVRPEVAIAIYESSGTPGTVEAVYISGRAEELTGRGLEPGIELFDRISQTENPAPGASATCSLHHCSASTPRPPTSTTFSSAAEIRSTARASTGATR